MGQNKAITHKKSILEIQGIELTPLKIIPSELGNVMHALKANEPGFKQFAEAYFSCVNYQITKGWKKHLEMTLNLIVPAGSICFYAYDDRPESPTKGCFANIELSLQNYQRLTVAPRIWLAFRGMSKELNLLLNIADRTHDPKEAISASLSDLNMPIIL